MTEQRPAWYNNNTKAHRGLRWDARKERKSIQSTHRDRAEANFKVGYNCSQAVFAAFSEEVGLPRQMALQLASGFGGGVGRMREVCGAFSGAVMALGALYGSDDPAQKTAVYAMVQELAAKFKAETGSLICRELLGLDQPEGSPVASPRTETYYKKRPCVEMVGLAADLLEQYLAEHPVPQREANA